MGSIAGRLIRVEALCRLGAWNGSMRCSFNVRESMRGRLEC